MHLFFEVLEGVDSAVLLLLPLSPETDSIMRRTAVLSSRTALMMLSIFLEVVLVPGLHEDGDALVVVMLKTLLCCLESLPGVPDFTGGESGALLKVCRSVDSLSGLGGSGRFFEHLGPGREYLYFVLLLCLETFFVLSVI